jgi:hypothetical protein
LDVVLHPRLGQFRLQTRDLHLLGADRLARDLA